MPGKRIVSLIASSTEIICALGFREEIVGRSHECDFPASVAEIPVCTESKLDTSASSREIDDQVKSILHDALAVYRVKEDLLKDLSPDVIVTQSQCDVCAVSLSDGEKAVSAWIDSPAKIVSLEPNSLEDVWVDIGKVAHALDAPDRGERLIGEIRNRARKISEKAASLGRRPSVACIEWIEPIMAAGNWMPELVELAGGTSLFGETGQHSPWLEWEALRDADPEVIAVLPCGFDLARTREELPPLLAQAGFENLRAVRDRRVYLVDGNQYFNRPGPRLVESLELLAEMLHPELFGTAHRGSAWEAL